MLFFDCDEIAPFQMVQKVVDPCIDRINGGAEFFLKVLCDPGNGCRSVALLPDCGADRIKLNSEKWLCQIRQDPLNEKCILEFRHEHDNLTVVC